MTRSIILGPCRVAAAAMLSATLLLATTDMARAETVEESELRGAAGSGNTGEVERLLVEGTDPNVPDHNGRTALHHAAETAQARILNALLEAGGDPDVRDRDGSTPLHLAAAFPYFEPDSQSAIRVLLNYRADPDRADRDGRTPLHLVARMHQEAASVLDLIKSGADTGKADSRGDTPLHYAVDRHGKFSADVVAALVEGGAGGSAVGSSSETPLQLFARVGTNDGRIVHALVDGGADPNGKNPEGETPLHTAIRNGGNAEKPKVVEALLAAGADPCIRDASSYTPYNTAREGGTVHGMLANAGGYDRACDGAPEIVEADRRMQASERAKLRSGPGTDYDKVGLLEVDDEVTVTGEAGEWLRIETPDGGEAFVHGSLLAEASGSTGTAPAVDLQPLCAGSPEGSACWWELADKPDCHFWTNYSRPAPKFVWSGQCTGGVANGNGTLLYTRNDGYSFESTGAFNFGKRHGSWVFHYTNGLVTEGPYVDGKRHGYWVMRNVDGTVDEGPYVDGKLLGRWVFRYPDGYCHNVEYSKGEEPRYSDC